MEQNSSPHIQLWCPRPFGTYSQNKPCNGVQIKKPFVCKPKEDGVNGAEASSENTPPAPLPPPAMVVPPASPTPSQVEDGRVLLDTWYVIKPGNTKEKIAFFVAHQCSGGGSGRASAVKVKGNWENDGSKAKRRRRSRDPSKGENSQGKMRDDIKEPEEVCLCPDAHGTPSCEASSDTDLLSVAEMVALVEQRTALAMQGYSRPCPGSSHPPGPVGGLSPVVFVSADQEQEDGERKVSDCNRVAEAVAHFESQQRGQNGVCREPVLSTTECVTSSPHSPGEVRIAFRISSREARIASEPGPSGLFAGCGSVGSGTRAKDKITCDLYQLVSPSRDALPNNVEFLLANATPKADGCGNAAREPADLEVAQALQVKLEAGAECQASDKLGSVPRDCTAGFHVDVVVTGVVDQCVFYGKDSSKAVKEETVRLSVGSPAQQQEPTCDDPPPGQLFFLHTQLPSRTPEEAEKAFLDTTNNNHHGDGADPSESAATGCGLEPETSDASLCRLYRHVSHDFLEIRFKIQRLLEPRQYMLLLPDHIMVKIFSYLPTQSLVALKCSCHYFKSIIEAYDVQATDSKWNRDPLYRDDPCKQCKKRYRKGDVSLCRWHPKPYHHDLPYGRSYWMCCRTTDKDTPGCRVGLHDNIWVQPCDMLRERARREDGR
ncbi:F-box only protein 46 [Rhinatrema bivittatum]|uniref:F-box only protein 46 n=1 Tax=Rhinatrema bivittatum TaxID=194408 RepID=UPI00112A5734|nr:F-box only protein 46 [Rhinatrema bivittatum]XP_029475962.1 F-box only protein 46 [Rhinatrema bivittatum]